MDKFTDTPSQRFYEFFQQKIQNNELTYDEFAESFGKTRQGAYTFFNQLKRGKQGITVKFILIAEKEYGLKPKALFV